MVKRLRLLAIDHESMAVLLNIFRVTMMFHNHAERNILDQHGLSFSGFTALWVLWIWGRKQSFELAAECGISKGTLTGVVKTLEKLGYAERKTHRTDERRVFVQLTPRGRALMKRLSPRINAAEVNVTRGLTKKEQRELAKMLRTILTSGPNGEA